MSYISLAKEAEEVTLSHRGIIFRIPPPIYPRQPLFYRPTGLRNLGRPCRSWRDQF